MRLMSQLLGFQMRKVGFKYFIYPGANISVDELWFQCVQLITQYGFHKLLRLLNHSPGNNFSVTWGSNIILRWATGTTILASSLLVCSPFSTSPLNFTILFIHSKDQGFLITYILVSCKLILLHIPLYLAMDHNNL